MTLHLTYLLLATALVSSQSDKKKLSQLLELQDTNDYVKLTPDLFKQFVQNQSKNYIIITYFTSTIYEDQCSGCSVLNPIFRKIAYSYKLSSASEDSKSREEKPVIFAILEFSHESMEILQKFQFQNIPDLFISSQPFTEDKFRFIIDRSDLFEYRDEVDYSAETVIEFINKKTGRDVRIGIRLMDYVEDYGVYVLSLVITLLVLLSFYKYYNNTKFWWGLSMAVYVVCIGGIVYDILQGANLGYADVNNEEVLAISQGARDQYVIEGLVMSAAISLSGIGLLIANLAAKIEGKWVIRIVGALGIAIWVASGFYVLSIYKKKVGWYSPSFDPPDGYIQGSLMRDQGNSF